MMKYDYLVVGAGLFGAAFTCEAVKKGRKVLVVEKRGHAGGNVYTETIEGITVHKYGAHIFHTSDDEVWQYVNSFAKFNGFVNSPLANYRGEIYHLPFNMNTFREMWGVETADEAKAIIARQVAAENIKEPKNLEEQALSMVGRDVYEKLVKEYTEKQWGRDCRDLPPFIIKRLPVRFTYDNNYFNDKYQGIPEGGYTPMIEKMLCGADVALSSDFTENRAYYEGLAGRVIYSGSPDGLFGYKFGRLGYRSLSFETEMLDQEDFQGNAVVNYTSHAVPFTRIIEHKYFGYGGQPKTIVTREYPKKYESGDEPYYPINDATNDALAAKYAEEARKSGYILGGRLGDYKYYDMDKTLKKALALAREIL
ncbi:MAG: UDP-galactopyranose mutase [Clostridia bacterium]|nr:UDP-galactopyranose mutase [Clostridia bacterium]